MLEAKIERAVCDYAKARGWGAEKFTSPNKRSVPDRLMSPPTAAMFFIEFKAEGKTPTVSQARDHEVRRKRGQVVFVVDSVPLGKFIVDEVTKGTCPADIYENMWLIRSVFKE